MSYSATLDTARTYLKIGRKGLARAALLRALAEVPDQVKVESNIDYLKIITLLTNLSINNNDWTDAQEYLEQGLRTKPDHTDLLFLRILFLFDHKRHDEALATVGMYFLSLGMGEEYRYEYTGAKAVAQLHANIIPKAYLRCANRALIKTMFTRLAEASHKPELKKVMEIIQGLEATVTP